MKSFGSFLILGSLFLVGIALAEGVQKRLLDPDNLKQDSKALNLPKLYNVIDDSLTLVPAGTYLPNRVYTVYVSEKNSWYFTLTNSRGKFQEPLELLDANTVLIGTSVGAKDPAIRYKLSGDWKWSVTKAPIEYFLWVLSIPQKLKRIRYQEVEIKK